MPETRYPSNTPRARKVRPVSADGEPLPTGWVVFSEALADGTVIKPYDHARFEPKSDASPGGNVITNDMLFTPHTPQKDGRRGRGDTGNSFGIGPVVR